MKLIFGKRALAALGVLSIGLLGVAVGVLWSRWQATSRAAPSSSAGAAARPAIEESKRRVLYWHDPMKPEVKFDKPGKSPFMDMELQAVYADDGAAGDSEAPTVHVSAGASQALGIRLGKVERAVIPAAIHAAGIVAYDESAQAVVQPRADGFVKRLRVRAPLAHVQQGHVLADVDVPVWREALGEYLALRAEGGTGAVGTTSSGIEGSNELRAAIRQRLSVVGVPASSIEQTERSGAVPDHFELTAPLTGVVTELALREGASFMGGTVVARINQTASVWVEGQLPETQAHDLAPGTPVSIRATARPGQVFIGRVLQLLPQVDSVTRTVGVRVGVANTGGQLSPGMYVDTEFQGRKSGEQLWVPSEAVIATGERSVVIVAREGGGFDVAKVTTGIDADGKTTILAGLTEGQSVVLSGQFLIDSEANLKSAVNRLTSDGATP